MTAPRVVGWPGGPARPIELSADARFTGRVRRLAIVSSVALGWLFVLCSSSTESPLLVGVASAGGWLTMPAVLTASIRVPALRYVLVVPSALVLGAVGWVVAFALPGGIAGAGWVTLLLGLALGGGLGGWFWMHALPVPAALVDPFSPLRLWLIRVHVTLVVAGMAAATTGWF